MFVHLPIIRVASSGHKPSIIVVGIWSLAEMAIEIWVMCQIRKNYSKPPRFDKISRFESLCRYSEIQVSQSISESENGKRPALSRKRCDILNIWQ